MLTILEKSSKGILKNHRSLKWKSSNILPDTPTETFWLIRTNFRLQTLLNHWKTQHFLGELPDLEFRCLIDFSGTLRDELFIALLRAKISEIPMEILWKRLNFLKTMLGQKPWEKESYFSREGDLKYELFEMRKPLRKVKKYSGYIKSPSSKKSSRGKLQTPEPEIFEWSQYSEIDYYEFLTVGRFSGSSMEISILPR